MRMTAYESMLASQQWTTQRAATRTRARHPNSRNGTSSQHIPTHRVITPWGLLALAFFVCCGGPAGTEPLASAGGPLLGLVAQLAFPLLFNIPLLLAIAELATAFPNDGGYAVWVLNAFGPFWGYQVGFWSWVASIFDCVVYTRLLFDTLTGPLGYKDTAFSYGVAYAIKAGVAIALSIPALFCTKTFIRALYIQLALVVVATVVLSGWGFSQTSSLAVFGETKPDEEATVATRFADTSGWKIDWTAYVGIFWYYDGFYLATVFGGEVTKPYKTYPQGLKWGFALTWLTYLLPMLAVVGAVSSWSSASSGPASEAKARWGHWSLLTEDAYPEIARAIGGQTLYTIALVGLVAGTTGMYMAELFCQAYQMRGMAENDLLPAIFMKYVDKYVLIYHARTNCLRLYIRRHPTYGTPRLSMYFSTVVVLAVLTANLDSVYEAKDALSALVELFIIFAAVRLRQTQPFVSRSFKSKYTRIFCTYRGICILYFNSVVVYLFSPGRDPRHVCDPAAADAHARVPGREPGPRT